jgi:hypothetical protein
MLITSSLYSRNDSEADRPLQRLAGAIMIQALQDASNGPRRHREEALDWIQGRTKSGFTFEFCCSLLGRNPNDVRERLKEKNVIPKWDSEMESGAAAAYAAGMGGGFAFRYAEALAKAS